jgi:hypothetical protein
MLGRARRGARSLGYVRAHRLGIGKDTRHGTRTSARTPRQDGAQGSAQGYQGT